MFKKILVSSLMATTLGFAANAQDAHKHEGRQCGAPTLDEMIKHGGQEVLNKITAIENHTRQFEQSYMSYQKSGKATKAVITIPVVVHVVYNTAAQNLSDAIIQSQIDVLNADFRRLNADRTNTPSAFTGVAADMEIQFQLATRDPQGNATNGIVRKQTTKSFFEYGGGDPNGVFVKQSSQGGSDAWNPSQYLNMWVCNFGGASSSLLGYATFPTDAGTFKDGVVMGYKYFGVNPSLGGVFGYGRTATHEVGHWLNLRHIWGDANCGNDFVADTPTQQTSNGGCPTFPKRTCGNTTSGDQFMNYMDYTNDQCMNMFTLGQKARAQALFATGGARVSLLTSPGLGSGTTPTCGVPAGLASASITASSATVSWGAVSGAASYSVQYKTSAATTWTTATSSTTSLNITGLAASTTYNYRIAAVCSGTVGTYSTQSSFTTSASGGGGTTPPTTYCASKGNSVADEWIQTVALARGTTSVFSNNSGKNAGYGNFTSTTYNLVRGSSHTITITAGWTATKYSEGYAVWIDYNRDGDFADAGELVYSRTATTTSPVSGSFTVPSTATLGGTRMRVSMKYNGVPTSCETFSYGEVEDYTLNITTSAAREEFEVGATNSVEFNVYPNPANVEATVALNFTSTVEDAKLTVLNLQGQEVATETFKNVDGAVNYKFNTANLQAGMYLVSVEYNGKREVQKLMVTK